MIRRYCTAGSMFAGIFAGIISCAFSRPAAAQFEKLAAKVPDSANAIVLLDGEKLLASPLAEKEGWKEKYEQLFASGMVAIPPDTRHMILASQIDYQFMRPVWELAVADFSAARFASEIARRTGGTLDSLGEFKAVALGDDSYCVELGPERLGVMSPGNRQTVARWLREVGSRTESGLSPYLQGTLTASKSSQIVIAFDLEDAVPPAVIRAKVEASPTLAGTSIDLDAAAAALSGIRGLVLEVAVTDGSFGRLMIHFRSDASVLAPQAKPLLMEVLANMGATIDDIADWKVTTTAERFTFQGPLSAAGRRRVLSLIDHPTAALIATKESPSQAAAPESSKAAKATQQYFKAIVSTGDDLREKSKDAKTFGESAMWIDNWARRINRLPTLNVDPEMLAYGRYATARMRDMSMALKGIGINSAAQQAQVYQQYATSGYVDSYGGSYGYTAQWNNVAGQRRAIGAQERAQGATTAQGISVEMENETVKIRQAMTQKYQIEF